MENHTSQEIEDTLEIVRSTIEKCERMKPKFKEGTSQHSLLRNRIIAMRISEGLLRSGKADGYQEEELDDALKPIDSIISKCEKAKMKFKDGSFHDIHFIKLINAMEICKSSILGEIRRRMILP